MVLVRFGCLCWSSQLTSFCTLFVMKHPHPLLVFILGPFFTLAELVQENIMHRGYVGDQVNYLRCPICKFEAMTIELIGFSLKFCIGG
jgi:hypothetical protein